ncbi:iron complex transport system substrate-binding protein [Hoeflea halophila]|uniref:Iron complex transport system substrate-binding protein n=1 Tax=Hoeflea halophila TaxID=714899 RepID=A0A286IFE3_9HYPH|nr:ABC transporter substrate-binding protein [Hoeflea halophila]SOE18865.1 iron complex transport system substrate-binding protein [Hoeflea halophila]
MTQTMMKKPRGLKRRFLLQSALVALLSSPLATYLTHAEGTEAKRVLAIGGAVTEIVYALGEQDRLVGRDSTSSYPPEATALPDVGYIRALSPEGVLSVKPDLILARENNGPPEAVEVLRSTGVRWVDVADDFTLAGISENIAIIAAELGVPEKGEALKKKVAADIARARAKLASIERRHKVMFVLALTDDKVNAAGKNTAAGNIVELAGGDNVITEFSGYKQISNEAVIEAAPEVIVMMNGRGDSGDHQSPNALLEAHPALSMTPAVRNGRIIRMDGLLLLGFGPRTGEAISKLADAFYGHEH